MPPGGEGGVPGGCSKQDLPPATGRCDEDTPSPSLPAKPLVTYQRRRQRQRKHDIPEGPLTKILSLLPYRSLCRFKCVSKQWLDLCSHPDLRPPALAGFFHNHLYGGDLRYHALNDRGEGGPAPPLVDPALPFLQLHGGYTRFRVEQCSGGLLLCKCLRTGPDGDDEVDLVVCNPATHEWTALPPIMLPDKVEYEEEEEDQEDEEEQEEDQEEEDQEDEEEQEEDQDDEEEQEEDQEEEEEQEEETEDEDEELGLLEPREAFLGFDPAFPSCFTVLVPVTGCLDDVAIYSSRTGQWRRRGWRDGAVPVVTAECVYVNHFMHLTIEEESIGAVHTDGERVVWDTIALPGGMEPSSGLTSMGRSQGLLHAWYIDPEECRLSVWVLEDYYSGRWTLKHRIDVQEVFYAESGCYGSGHYEVFAIHPERDLIFITDEKKTTLAYDMDKQQVYAICTSGEFLGGLPYIPCFAKWLPDYAL